LRLGGRASLSLGLLPGDAGPLFLLHSL
jgi:hypothetical protein